MNLTRRIIDSNTPAATILIRVMGSGPWALDGRLAQRLHK